MAMLLKRLYLSKRHQYVLFGCLLIFVIYYAIIHSGPETLHNVDITRKESIVQYIEHTLQEALKEDKGTGCDVPKLDPFAKEVLQFDKKMPPIECGGKDWVKCYMSKCSVDPDILKVMKDVKCTYRDIIFQTDYKRYIGPITMLEGDSQYTLSKSDHVKIGCTGTPKVATQSAGFGTSWSGHGAGFRNTVERKSVPHGRENAINVLIFGFDSTSKNGFIRKMPRSYKVLTEELKATVLNGYNIVGDGTPAALFPILTGKTELELPEARKSIKGSGHLDDMPFIFYKLKEIGYRTAYFEDMPWIGTFQYRFNGFLKQPADHYLRAFFLEEYENRKKGSNPYCVGGTPRHKIMMNLTEQFFQLDGKQYAFTFIADITHDDFNMISSADNATVEFLRALQAQGRLENTMLLVMGDHGPRYANVRDTYQGKLEERLPLMAIRLPEVLKAIRPNVQSALNSNVDALTTPHDIYATVLDALDMKQHWNTYKIHGADLPRGMTLLETVPRNRSCSEAGIEPHWCTCLRWEDMSETDPMYKRAAVALVDNINAITQSMRSKCAVRTLTSIQWVMKRRVNNEVLQFQGARDADGYVGKFGGSTTFAKNIYQVKITVGPGKGIYEASVSHNLKDDTMTINSREITRTNAERIDNAKPHLAHRYNNYDIANTWVVKEIL